MLLLVPLIFLIHLILLLNTRFTLWPEMVVYPYLLNNDFLLYRDIINPYQPAFIYLLSLYAKLFGYQPAPYQIFTWFIILIIDLVVFFIANKLFDKRHALISTIVFILLSIPFGINGLWFDLVQTPLILLSIYFFILFWRRSNSRRSIIASLIFLTGAYLIKQQALWIAICYLFLIVIKLKKFRRIFPNLLLFILIPISFFILEVLIFNRLAIVEDFLYWTFYFPFIQASKMPGYILLPQLKQLIIIITIFAALLPVAFKNSQNRLITGFALISLLFAYPRFDFFHLIPFIALYSFVISDLLINVSKNRIVTNSLLLIAVSILSLFAVQYLYKNWTHEVRFFEKQITDTAQLISQISAPSQPLYIQNGPDQILPLSNRLPVKPWADEFPWYLEIKGQQEKIVNALASQSPRFIIYKPYESKDIYEIGSYQPGLITSFIDNNYQNFMTIADTYWIRTKK